MNGKMIVDLHDNDPNCYKDITILFAKLVHIEGLIYKEMCFQINIKIDVQVGLVFNYVFFKIISLIIHVCTVMLC